MKTSPLHKLCQAAALALVFSASAQASQTFNFTFSDVEGWFNGISSISGIITLNGDGDGTFQASAIQITSDLSGIFTDTRNFADYSIYNSFSVSGGNISYANFFGRFYDDNAGYINDLGIGAAGLTGYACGYSCIADAAGGTESLQFSPTAAPVPEPSTLALFAAGAGVMGAARRRRAAGKKAA